MEDLAFENIDILEHHEKQPRYLGCLVINAGDGNVIRNVRYHRIRVEHFEHGRLIDLKVFHNPDYNPLPGKRIKNVVFDDIDYHGNGVEPSQLAGFDVARIVTAVTFRNVKVNGGKLTGPETGLLEIGEFVAGVEFR